MGKVVPVIRDCYSSDVENLTEWAPERLDQVYFPLEISIGATDRKGADLFQVLVATPEAVRQRLNKGVSFPPSRHVMIVANYDWPKIFGTVSEIAAKCSGESWEEVASLLSRYFAWEYDDYQEV